MINFCVFMGFSFGKSDVYREKVYVLGVMFVYCDIGLVYGGVMVGLMGVVVDGVLL